jgi:hypothetical protein
MPKIIIAGLFLLALAGCIDSQTKKYYDSAAADYGECPQNYEQTIKNIVSETLKDPYSAQYRFEAPYKGYANKGFQGREYGWIVTVGINAKNSFGAYTGEQKHSYLFRGEHMEFEFWTFDQ